MGKSDMRIENDADAKGTSSDFDALRVLAAQKRARFRKNLSLSKRPRTTLIINKQ